MPVNRGENKNKLIKANILKKKEVVVKISKRKKLLKKDYDISIRLDELNCINFAKYLGFFSCKDDIDNYNLDKKLPKYFCKNNCTMNYFLFMNYYKYGSIINYIPNNIDEIISILNQVLSSIVLAYEKYGFIHGDLHPGNVLCKSTKRKSIKYSFSNIDKEINTLNLSEHLCVDKELFYGTKWNKIHIVIISFFVIIFSVLSVSPLVYVIIMN